MVTVRAGEMLLGSPAEEIGRNGSREEIRLVALSRNFLLGANEVTQGEFRDVMGYNPSRFYDCGPRCPVESLTWAEAAAYCNRRSELEGLRPCYECSGERPMLSCRLAAALSNPYECPGYRLPTEAEWEYAARAGTETATYEGDLEGPDLSCEEPSWVLHPIAWVCFNSERTTHEAATREPNGWGFYDMLGNVWEWCGDSFEESLSARTAVDPWTGGEQEARVVRGGAFDSRPLEVRAAFRGRVLASTFRGAIGFRVARTIQNRTD